MNTRLLSLLAATLIFLGARAQTDSTGLDTTKKHSPKMASLLSAALPGAGQIYNRKYWKVPVIYAGLGAFAYFASDNWTKYQRYKQAYLIRLDSDPATFDEYDTDNPNFVGVGGYSTENLNLLQSSYHRYFELNCVGMAVFYVLNVVDAAVDAHLFHFDVSDRLSIQTQPWIGGQATAGLNVRLQFR